MTLVDAGVLELDAPMRRYLPEVEFTDPSTNLVTVRHLLNQTSGIPADAPRAPSRNASLAEHVVRHRGRRTAEMSRLYMHRRRDRKVETGGALRAGGVQPAAR